MVKKEAIITQSPFTPKTLLTLSGFVSYCSDNGGRFLLSLRNSLLINRLIKTFNALASPHHLRYVGLSDTKY